MKIIQAKAEQICEKDPYKKVELAARTCYKSESKITEDSAVRMCKGLIKSQHTAMLEHAVLCFELLPADPSMPNHMDARDRYMAYLAKYPYLHVTANPIIDLEANTCKTRILASGNLRAISERGVNDPIFRATQEQYPNLVWGKAATDTYHIYPEVVARIVNIDDLDDLTLDEIGEHKVLTFRFITNRGVSHELVRHRPCSFAQESTRYCLYSKDQFNSELTFIQPADWDEWSVSKQHAHLAFLQVVEKHYLELVSGEDALKAQQARDDLTNGVKTEIVTTAYMKEWKHIFNLRAYGTTGAPHPDIKFVMGQALYIAMQDPIAARYLEASNG